MTERIPLDGESSDDDDMGALWRAHRKFKQEQREKRHETNREIIDNSGIKYIDKGTALLFRGKIKADFYPSAGSWKQGVKMYYGGARKFIAWWLKHNEENNDARD